MFAQRDVRETFTCFHISAAATFAAAAYTATITTAVEVESSFTFRIGLPKVCEAFVTRCSRAARPWVPRGAFRETLFALCTLNHPLSANSLELAPEC